ncbi:MAG: hypothetical protein D6729_03765 [Deltaproteobacteria bacterium]|nr:MAG: hypothetical protein D6729_03765 [Deltaproteobacteria bacterium]
MSLTKRVLRILRANVGHALRDARARIAGDHGRPVPAPDDAALREAEAEIERELRQRAEARAKARENVHGPRAAARHEDFARAYRALELPYGADPEAIRRAHRRLLRLYHPDRHSTHPEKQADATRLSQELTRARDLLLLAWESGEIP